MEVNLSSFRLSSPVVKALVVAISAILILMISGFILTNKEVALSVDGKTSHLVTRADTVAELLAEKNVKISSHDKIKPSLDAALIPGGRVTVKRAVPLAVDINGKTRKVWSTDGTVGQAVEHMGIDTSADIKLDPKAETRLAAGMSIRLQLLNRWIEKVQSEIGYETKREDDPSLAKGLTRVAVKGKPGIKETIIEHVMAGGREIAKVVRGENALAAPVGELVKVGTRVPRAAVAGIPAPSLNVSRGGRSLTMVATAYAAYTGGAGNRTATGTGVYKGIVAVDPRVIPLGTRLYIDGYGEAVAADTGGAIKGNRIDLGFASAGECYQWGRRTVSVRVLD